MERIETKEKNYYQVLGVKKDATTLDIQKAFEALCDEYVDINNKNLEIRKTAAEILFSLTKAYETLTDPFLRLGYDRRLYGDKPPINKQVDTIFSQAITYSKKGKDKTALRYFKEVVSLYPHWIKYRVRLAIEYQNMGYKKYAEKELKIALRMDPNNEYAQDVVARVLFNVSDTKKVNLFSKTFIKKIPNKIHNFLASFLNLNNVKLQAI